MFGLNNTFQENVWVKQHFSRKLPATGKIKHAPLKITKMGAIEHGEECLLTTYCDDHSQTILLIKLLAVKCLK